MLHKKRSDRLTRSIKTLFGTKKPNITRLNHKEIYYRDYYFPKNVCNGIDAVAKIEHTSKINATVMLMIAGLSSYMGEKITEHVENEQAALDRDEKLKLTRLPGKTAWTFQNLFSNHRSLMEKLLHRKPFINLSMAIVHKMTER